MKLEREARPTGCNEYSSGWVSVTWRQNRRFDCCEVWRQKSEVKWWEMKGSFSNNVIPVQPVRQFNQSERVDNWVRAKRFWTVTHPTQRRNFKLKYIFYASMKRKKNKIRFKTLKRRIYYFLLFYFSCANMYSLIGIAKISTLNLLMTKLKDYSCIFKIF